MRPYTWAIMFCSLITNMWLIANHIKPSTEAVLTVFLYGAGTMFFTVLLIFTKEKE